MPHPNRARLAPRTASVLSAALAAALLSSCAKPVADFAYRLPEDNTAPAPVTFENESEKAEAYTWDFGDGTTSEEANPEHRYTQSGNYLVTLRAAKGRRSTLDSQRIQILAPLTCMVEITTPHGRMLVELSDETPQHRDNFLKLVSDGFYEDLLFHRVIDGFMLQGGDPNSRDADANARLGSGGPGYTVPAEFKEGLAHVKGALAAVRQGDAVNPTKASSGSQFYIVSGREVDERELEAMAARKGINYTPETKAAYLEHGGVPFLDGEYTVFGRVVEGMDVIDEIAAAKTLPGDRPAEDITMRMKVIR